MTERGQALRQRIQDLIGLDPEIEIPVTETHNPRSIADLLDIPEGGTYCMDCEQIWTHYRAGSNYRWKQHRCESAAYNTLSGDLKLKPDPG